MEIIIFINKKTKHCDQEKLQNIIKNCKKLSKKQLKIEIYAMRGE